MKLFVRFLLSLCILLLSGHNQLHAHVCKSCIRYPPIKIRERALHASLGFSQDKHALHVKSNSHGKKRINEKIGATDEEEDDNFIPFNKCLEISSYFTAFFGSYIPEYFCGHIKKRLLHCKLFSYLPSYTYLLFRTIRL